MHCPHFIYFLSLSTTPTPALEFPHWITSEECARAYNTMNSRELIDAQFDRAVEIVQNLPKTGPVQTGYEEKLSMYRCAAISSTVPSLFPQLICASASISKVSPSSVTNTNSSPTPSCLSDRRKCYVPETGNMGYARSCQMVFVYASLSSAQAYIVAGTHGQSTKISILTRQNGYMWMLS